jgi:hypothetical protein
MISSNFLGSVFGCQVQDIMANNMLVKHLLGFLTLFFFVSLVDTSEYSPVYKLMFTTIVYLCFMLSTKLNSNMWIIFITMLALVYIMFIVKDSIKDNEYKQYIGYTQLALVCGAVVVLVIGSIYYLGEKKIEYGDKFSYSTFFVGTPTCKRHTPKTNKTIIETFKIGLSPTSPPTSSSWTDTKMS